MVAGCGISTFTVRWISPTTPDLLATNPIPYIRIGRHGQSDALLMPTHKASPTGSGDIVDDIKHIQDMFCCWYCIAVLNMQGQSQCLAGGLNFSWCCPDSWETIKKFMRVQGTDRCPQRLSQTILSSSGPIMSVPLSEEPSLWLQSVLKCVIQRRPQRVNNSWEAVRDKGHLVWC